MRREDQSKPGHAEEKTPESEAEHYAHEMAATVQRMLADKTSIGDLKIANAALKEMRNAFKVFALYRGVRKVSVFGSARTQPGDRFFLLAEEFARRMAEVGYMIITGAGPGIMEAAQRGAGRDHSFGVNIRLPFEQAANEEIRGDPKLMSFRYFFTRKLFFVKEADAIVLFPGGFGTHDEGFEALTLVQTGKSKMMPILFLDVPRGTYWKTWERYVVDHILRRNMIGHDDLALFKVVRDVDEAVYEITHFYRVFHSARFVDNLLVIRLNERLPDDLVGRLATEFADIVVSGSMEQRDAFPAERSDPGIFHLPRLVFHFDRTHYGRLRKLIDRINAA